ncbi:GL12618 [Drosophila persimilis]|uniref:GL12618 n=1 Tax=Drosophila persimilis TaxID=7234 RepID=B4GLQ7_DROPE|nr:GL12618 [Drosophila persimilis]
MLCHDIHRKIQTQVQQQMDLLGRISLSTSSEVNDALYYFDTDEAVVQDLISCVVKELHKENVSLCQEHFLTAPCNRMSCSRL